MNRIIILICFMTALAYAACAHYPTDGSGTGDGGGSCSGMSCPTDDPPDAGTPPNDGGGSGSDGGSCTGPNCPTDGGNGGGSDGGSGGSCSCDMQCGCGQTCEHGTCVQTGCCSDDDCPDGKACRDGTCVCDGDDSDGTCRPGKTLLCHYPPGNPSNRHDICVGNAAVQAHLHHGDTLGACP